MLPLVLALVGQLLVSGWGVLGDDYVHQPIHYHSQTDSGTYNYGYDTGLHGSHQFHQEHKDGNGVVRGRYGYTDPNGKLRLVHYKSGPNGFEIISDTENARTQQPKAIRRPEPSINSIESSRTQYKPIYSADYYRKPVPAVTPAVRPEDPVVTKPRTLRKPRFSQHYRESGNSRLYIAGRDYGATAPATTRPARIDPHPHHNHNDHHSHRDHTYMSHTRVNRVRALRPPPPARSYSDSERTVFHRAPPTAPVISHPQPQPIYTSPPALAPVVNNHIHAPEVRESVIHGAPVVESHTHTEVAAISHHPVPPVVTINTHMLPPMTHINHPVSPVGAGPIESGIRFGARAGIPTIPNAHHTSPYTAPYAHPSLPGTRPMVYSGRGIPSPVARLRAAAAAAAASGRAPGDGLRARS